MWRREWVTANLNTLLDLAMRLSLDQVVYYTHRLVSPNGRCTLTTPETVEFNNRFYQWWIEFLQAMRQTAGEHMSRPSSTAWLKAFSSRGTIPDSLFKWLAITGSRSPSIHSLCQPSTSWNLWFEGNPRQNPSPRRLQRSWKNSRPFARLQRNRNRFDQARIQSRTRIMGRDIEM